MNKENFKYGYYTVLFIDDIEIKENNDICRFPYDRIVYKSNKSINDKLILNFRKHKKLLLNKYKEYDKNYII